MTHRFALVLLALSLVVGCDNKPKPLVPDDITLSCPNSELLYKAALDNLYAEGMRVGNPAWIRREQDCLEQTAAWARTLPDPCVKQAYLNVLAVAQKIAKGEAANLNEAVAIKTLAATLPIPPACARNTGHGKESE